MGQQQRRLTSMTVVSAMLFGSVGPAFAQADSTAAADGPPVDPPALVGRVALVQGTVSYHGEGATTWDQAAINFPVTTGSALWTQPSAAAELDVGPTRVALDQGTEFDIDTLNDQQFIATAPQGRVYLHVVGLQSGQVMQVRTPRGTVAIARPGDYEIVAGDTTAPTLVTVHTGLAQVAGPDFTLNVEPRQTAQMTGEDRFTGEIVAERGDPFLSAQLARDQPRPPVQRVTSAPAYEPPPVVQNMTGYEAVASTGEWEPTADYGRVWYPPVERDWVPYRHGHWAFVAPWGWTWVDDAPWGFAPFHYGRWVEIHDRWAWTPVERGVAYDARPVYAPALVSFVGVGVGVGVGIGLGVGLAASVGWIPLGPREVYRPSYRTSDNYLRNVNRTNVTNVTNISNTTNVTNVTYVNNRAATVVPSTAMTQSQPVAARAQPVNAAALASARPLARPPVQPTQATAGVTTGVAQAYRLPPAAPGTQGAATVTAPRPGPPIRPVSVTPAGSTPVGAAQVGAGVAPTTGGRPAAAALPPLNGSPAARGAVPAGTSATPTSGAQATPTSGAQATPTSGAQATPTSGAQATPTSGAPVAPGGVNGRPAVRPAGGLPAPTVGQAVPTAGTTPLPRPAALGQQPTGQSNAGQPVAPRPTAPGPTSGGTTGQGAPIGPGTSVAPGTPVAPRPGTAAPLPGAPVGPGSAVVPRPSASSPVSGAPVNGAPVGPGSAVVPRPSASAPVPGTPVSGAPVNGAPVGPGASGTPHPVIPAPIATAPNGPGAPVAPRVSPQGQAPALHQPAAPTPLPQVQPQVRATPQPQPVPQPQVHAAPPPQPAPQVQVRQAPPPQVHNAPPPPPPQVHNAPPPQVHNAPPPQQHPAPAKTCPPGHPNC